MHSRVHSRLLAPAAAVVVSRCRLRCVQDANDRGLFRVPGEDGVRKRTTPPDMAAICRTACEVAQGMAFLHSHDVVHGGEVFHAEMLGPFSPP